MNRERLIRTRPNHPITKSPDHQIIRLATFAMGTRFEFVLAGEDERHLRAAGEEALAEIQVWHRRLNYFAPDSLVQRINTLASSHPVALDPETFALLARCVALHDQTCGTFDITIAPLMRKWGFRPSAPGSAGGPDGDARNSYDNPPAEPGANGCAFGTRHIELNARNRTIRFNHPGIEIDLAAIAKGFALDLAAGILRDNGIACALLHGGTSSVVAIGAPPHEEGWKVRIAPPPIRAGTRSLAHKPVDIALHDQALSISAPHGRTIEHDGETLGHIIDPRTGAPARGADLAAVICETATDAEAWSTALLVLNERPATLRDDIASILYDHENGWRMGGTGLQARAAACVVERSLPVSS